MEKITSVSKDESKVSHFVSYTVTLTISAQQVPYISSLSDIAINTPSNAIKMFSSFKNSLPLSSKKIMG